MAAEEEPAVYEGLTGSASKGEEEEEEQVVEEGLAGSASEDDILTEMFFLHRTRGQSVAQQWRRRKRSRRGIQRGPGQKLWAAVER